MYVIQFKNPINEISKLNINNLTSRELDYWSKAIGEIDGTIDRISEIMQESQAFLKFDNIIKLKKLSFITSNDVDFLLLILKAKYSIDIIS